MINFSQTTSLGKRTKQEKENARRVNIFWKYEELILAAKNAKSDYLDCKGRSSLHLDEKNRIALAELIVIFKADALEYWNKAQALRNEYPFLNKMIETKK